MKKFLMLLFTVTVLSSYTIQAQSSNNDDSEDFSLPALSIVIDSVLKNNGLLQSRKKHIGVKEFTLASERVDWTRNIGIQTDTRYGTLNNISTNGLDNLATSIATNTRQFNYSVGFYVNLTVFNVINRKNQIGLARLEVDEAKDMVQFQEDEIRQNVIKLYQDLLLKQKILRIKSKNLGDGKVNMQMIEKEFRNGVVPVAEYVRITSITADVEVDYELAKSEFITSKKILEDMARFTF
ncbi:outer membrane protein TolC [Flavobacterium sp. PL11]|uniref:TolC family protein n=1 Tax=Flavobacterium sp. PL11 TaxID=3071717 RepID=UPI002E0BCDDF|nr:outer membrane protein TolC [Flavobacterium sp. PL11]